MNAEEGAVVCGRGGHEFHIAAFEVEAVAVEALAAFHGLGAEINESLHGGGGQRRFGVRSNLK